MLATPSFPLQVLSALPRRAHFQCSLIFNFEYSAVNLAILNRLWCHIYFKLKFPKYVNESVARAKQRAAIMYTAAFCPVTSTI